MSFLTVKPGEMIRAYQLRPGMITRQLNLYVHGVKCKPRYSVIVDGWGEAEPIPTMPGAKYTQRSCNRDASHVSDALTHVDCWADQAYMYVGMA